MFSALATRLFGRRHGAWIAIVGVAAYTLLVGTGASVVRVAIIGSLALTAPQIGRCAAGLNTLLQRGGLAPATALLVGDNGSERATGAGWVDALDPRLALISVSAKRGPAQPILDRLAGRAILRTDLNGTARLFTDGQQLWVEVERR